MKKLAALFFICFSTINFSQINVSPEFSELKGMEDQLGNTHLFYRIYSYETDTISGEFQRYNSAYHMDLINNFDTLYLIDYVISNILIDAKIVEDYDIWNQNTDLWISCGGIGGDPDLSAYIERYDGYSNYNALGIAKKNSNI
jgi:hypothetical protein